jgi:hypothetical protein
MGPELAVADGRLGYKRSTAAGFGLPEAHQAEAADRAASRANNGLLPPGFGLGQPRGRKQETNARSACRAVSKNIFPKNIFPL